MNNNAAERTSPDNFFDGRVAAALLAIALLVMAIISAYQGAKKEVNLLVDGKQYQVHTFHNDVNGLLNENGIVLKEKDRVSPVPATVLNDGMTVKVRRAVPVQLQVGTEQYQLISSAETVGEVLKEKGVVLGERDVVTPGLSTRLDKEARIQVDRITTQVIEEKAPIPYRIQRENDATLFRGVVRVINSGREGLEKKMWEIVYKNGEKMEKNLLASSVLEVPVDRVVRVGTMQTVNRGGNTIRFSRAYDMVATAYSHTGNNTSTGISPHVGVVAVDPSVIPMGSRLYVEGYGYGRAMDKGRSIKGSRIDVFLESHSQAVSWGRRTVKVYLLE
ncbi:ubiquitin-like domain-containing protein [Desulfoscipio gibsoniae]